MGFEFNINYPVVIKNVLPTQKFLQLYDGIFFDWVLLNGADPNDSDDKYTWGKKIEDELSLTNIDVATFIKLKIQKVLKTDIRLVKIHVNGQTSNQLTKFHVDYYDSDFWTFVLFTSPEWNSNWGGEFILQNPVNKSYKYVPYIPNTGCLLPSNWMHVGTSPNGFTDKLRTTIAFSYCSSKNYYLYKKKYDTIDI